jgi:hypothetical protein
MGQSYLSFLAKNAGLVANPAHDDKAGWDFELETPSPRVVEYHAHSKPLYRIQVKATLSSSTSASMTFSSLLSLIRFPGPSFVILLRFLPDGTAVEARLLHIDRAIAEEVLKKMRTREVALKEKFQVNKHTYAIRFPPEASVNPLNGARLKALLANVTAPTYLDYVTLKARWLQELEKKGGAFHIDLKLEKPSDIRAMADGLLGYDTEFSADVVRYPAPMGIPDDVPKHAGDFVKSKLGPREGSAIPCVVRLRSKEFGPLYSFAGSSYSSVGVAPPPLAGARTKTSMFDIVLRVSPPELQFIPANLEDPSLLVPIRELRAFLAYTDEASFEAVTEMFLEIAPTTSKPPIRMKIGSRFAIPEGFPRMKNAFDVLYRRLDELGLSDARIRPLLYWTSRSAFWLLVHVDRNFSPSISFEFSAPTLTAPSTDADVAVFEARFELDHAVVVFHGALFGKIEFVAPGKLKGTFDRTESIGQIVIPSGTDINAAVLSEKQRIKQTLIDCDHRVVGA